MNRSVSVVVPCWNTHAGLDSYISEMRTALVHAGWVPEFLLTLDGPNQDRHAVDAVRSQDDIQVISLRRNVGQHAATLAGIQQSRCHVILTVDDDGQHGPADAVRLLAVLEATDSDVVYGSRQDDNQHWWRKATSSWTKRYLSRVTGMSIDSVSSFRALRATPTLMKAAVSDPFFNLDGYLFNTTSWITSTVVEGRPARGGRSRYGLKSLVSYGWTLVTITTYAPLRILTLAAIVSGIGALLLAGVFVISYFTGSDQVAGFSAIATMTAAFGAFQLFALGIIAEYVARIHGRTLGTPTYVLPSER